MSTSTNTNSLEDIEEDKLEQLQLTLPNKLWLGKYPTYLYQGFWCLVLEPTISFQTHFQAQDSDIILASLPKSGTTWLKFLIFSVINRNKFPDFSKHPLHTQNPHELVLQFELKLYSKIKGSQPDLTKLPSPRLFATHIPYPSLPDSIKTSKCKIVYVCRNPLDTFISLWHFNLKCERDETITPDMIMKYFENFCKGGFAFGPYEDYILGYWDEHTRNPDKVLFLEYEGLKADPSAQVMRLAEFMGCPFSEEEQKASLVEEIIKLCSLDSLKEKDVNKSGKFYDFVENNALFRKGEVGDWINYLNPSMIKELLHDLHEKLKKSGFSFKYYNE